jgi:hypothetical protein
MIADDKDHPIETMVKLLTLPVWGPCYLAGVGAVKVWKALQRRKPEQVQQAELLQTWMPTREFERAVFAALILAGEPINNNRRLAELMDCSPGEASRRVAQLKGVIRKARKGREVLISLH